VIEGKLDQTAPRSEKPCAMSNSDKIQAVFAPRTRDPSPSGRFVLLSPLPLEVAWGGKAYRLHVEREAVSKELRLFAKDIGQERKGQYAAYLLATASEASDLDRRIFNDGITCESRPGYGMFSQLVSEGRARAFEPGGRGP
jgi:hypothetical protein